MGYQYYLMIITFIGPPCSDLTSYLGRLFSETNKYRKQWWANPNHDL